MTGIYKITNLINGKTYIGQSIDIENRWEQHKKCYEKNPPYLRNAMLKYGVENFAFEVIEECLKEKLNEKEVKFISEYKLQGKSEYNIAGGGYEDPFKYKTDEEKKIIFSKLKGLHNSPSTEFKIGHTHTEESLTKNKEAHLGRKASEETKRKISEGNKGKVVPEEVRRKISESEKGKIVSEEIRKKISENSARLFGENHPMFGRKHSEETRIKLSESHKGQTPSNSKKVVCLDTGEIFNSIAELCKVKHIGKQTFYVNLNVKYNYV